MEELRVKDSGEELNDAPLGVAEEENMSGTLIKTEHLVDGEQNDRINNFIFEKFNVEDIRELEMRPEDSESDDDDEDGTFKSD